MAMASKGVLYCAVSKAGYLEEAIIAATQLRKLFPKLPISLFTDMLDYPFDCANLFNSIFEVPTESYPPTWGGGLLARIGSLGLSPYTYTIHMDTDTRVVSDKFLSLFDICENFDLAMAEAMLGKSFDRRYCLCRLFNPSVMVYRHSDLISELFHKWQMATQFNLQRQSISELRHIRDLTPEEHAKVNNRLLMSDQISLAELITPELSYKGLRTRLLDDTFNVRDYDRYRASPETAVILHLHRSRYPSRSEGLQDAQRYIHSLTRSRPTDPNQSPVI